VIRSRPAREWVVAVAAGALLACARPALAWMPAALRRSLEARPFRVALLPRLSPERTAAIVRGVATRHPFRSTCLEQAATLVWLLAAQRTAAHMTIGVRREGPALAAHAWVERDGGVLLGEPLQSGFTPLTTPVDPCRA
jgi:transglutaminase superfamily protein